jgi:hypothetical protein
MIQPYKHMPIFLVMLLAWPGAACSGEGNGGGQDGSDVEDADAADYVDASDGEEPSMHGVWGRTWIYLYSPSSTPPIYSGLAGDITVTLDGEGLAPGDFTDITDSYDCNEPWVSEGNVISCGRFVLPEVPPGINEVMLRGAPREATDPPSISKIFDPVNESYQLLVLVSQDMIDAALLAWGGLEQDAASGVIVGVLAENLQDVDPYQISGFIGGATVGIDPDPQVEAGGDYLLVYYNTANPADASLTSTDAEESLFFAVNVPPRDMSDPYTMSVSSSTHEFQPARFAVEAGTVTYVLLIASQ